MKKLAQEFSALLCILQWHNLLCRLLFSALRSSYAYSGNNLGDGSAVWQSALDEVILNLMLCPAWVAELDRPWLPTVYASDASTTFGFFVFTSHLGGDWARMIASHVCD